MRKASGTQIGFCLVAFVAAILIVIGAPHDRRAPVRIAASVQPEGSEVAFGGVTLRSTAIEPFEDRSAFPVGPGSDLAERNCTGCHSATMALAQPHLSAAQWQAIVAKMRDIYRAPVTPADEAAIVAYLMQIDAPLQVATIADHTGRANAVAASDLDRPIPAGEERAEPVAVRGRTSPP